MACTETYATLRIFSTDLHPDKIGEILGIVATHTRPLDPDSKYRPRRENHSWSWETRKKVDSTDNVEHLAAVIECLDGRTVALKQLRDMGCKTDICNYWVSNGQGGPSLDVDMMGTLHGLGLPIWWDIYFESEDED
ncbi:MAG: DUF4279 domain-containing protein [Pseudomonadota bacterium]